MIEVTFRRRMTLVVVATVGMLTAGVAGAGDLNYAEQAYRDELNRCVALLRPAMPVTGVRKITYEVQEIELRGPWYQFEISVSVEDESGATRIGGYRVGCKSNRWIDSSTLQARRNVQSLPLTKELLASE